MYLQKLTAAASEFKVAWELVLPGSQPVQELPGPPHRPLVAQPCLTVQKEASRVA